MNLYEQISNSNTMDKIINDLIIDEQEAIIGYEKAKTNIPLENYDRVSKVFDHIIEEEKEHIEELKELLEGE